jgi:hypothetical protein
VDDEGVELVLIDGSFEVKRQLDLLSAATPSLAFLAAVLVRRGRCR